jgi:hypothetical protein
MQPLSLVCTTDASVSLELSGPTSHLSHLFREVLSFCGTRASFDPLRSVLPGIAFSLDLIEQTGQYGVAEVLLSSFIAAGVFSFFGAQPLCIAGVTGASSRRSSLSICTKQAIGPITVLNGTIYTILNTQSNRPNYLHFMGWVYLWGAILHWIAAVLNCEYFYFTARR